MIQYGRVPIELVELVDASALQLYVALCKYARRDGYCRPSNPELCERTGQSDATVRRSLKRLCDVGAVERRGRQRRMLRVVPIETLSLTSERKSDESIAHPRAAYRSPVSDGSTSTEVDPSHSLRSCERSDESGDEMQQHDDALPGLDVEIVEHEEPIGRAALGAFFDAYGDEPISRQMIGRLGKRFKELGVTYSRELVVEAARQMGASKCANPSAAEAFALRLRREQATSDAGWSKLAADTYSQLPDPYAQHS